MFWVGAVTQTVCDDCVIMRCKRRRRATRACRAVYTVAKPRVLKLKLF